jgi:polar amino acid transport system substrate-binding protein
MMSYLSRVAKIFLIIAVPAFVLLGARQAVSAEKLTSAQITQATATLAPTGKLRVGLYPGSPDSLIQSDGPEGNKGMGFEIGRALAKYLNVPFEPIIFPKNGDVLAAAKEGKIDFVFVNATPVRAEFLDFVAPTIFSEQSYLVGPKCEIRSISEIDRPFMKIGVSGGSTSQAVLPTILKSATLIPTKSLKETEQLLLSGEIDAFATNKGILFELADKIPNTVVLDGAWGLERIAIGIPKGRSDGLPVIAQFSNAIIAEGLVADAVKRAGMRGVKLNN